MKHTSKIGIKKMGKAWEDRQNRRDAVRRKLRGLLQRFSKAAQAQGYHGLPGYALPRGTQFGTIYHCRKEMENDLRGAQALCDELRQLGFMPDLIEESRVFREAEVHLFEVAEELYELR